MYPNKSGIVFNRTTRPANGDFGFAVAPGNGFSAALNRSK